MREYLVDPFLCDVIEHPRDTETRIGIVNLGRISIHDVFELSWNVIDSQAKIKINFFLISMSKSINILSMMSKK